MTLQAVKETQFSEAFRQSLATTDQATWLKIMRENAFAYFVEHGFPRVEVEDWKYTNVAKLAGENYAIATNKTAIDREQISEFVFAETASSALVFVDGIFNQELSNVSAVVGSGAVVLTLREAFVHEEFAETVKSNLARFIAPNTDGFTALNAAFLSDGAFLFVPKNQKAQQPIQLLFISTNGKASFPRVLAILEQGAEAQIVEHYARTEEERYLTNAAVEIVLKDDARLIHYRVQRESHKALHVGTTNVDLARNSFYDSTNITLGGELSRHDVNVKFNAQGAECFVDGLYLVSGEQHTDTHSIIDHTVPNCTSHQTYKGVLNDRARAVFNGKIFVRTNAAGTNGYQSNKNLLLSNEARVDTKPQLEIFNDDVKCSHGATVGQIEEEELFYLLSRGLSESLARNLLTYGFAEEVINKIQIESIKKQLDEAVLNRLNTKI